MASLHRWCKRARKCRTRHSNRGEEADGVLEGERAEQRREDREEGKIEREETGWKEETWSAALSRLVPGGVP